MKRPFLILACATLVLSGCGFGQSRLNPVNWFGSPQEVQVEPATEAATENSVATATAEPASATRNPLLPRRQSLSQRREEARNQYFGVPVETVDSLIIERVPGGALLRVTGTAATANVYDVRLTPENGETPVDGVLTYRLEGILQNASRPVGNSRQRQVVAARRVTDNQLRGVQSIRIAARTNAQVSRR